VTIGAYVIITPAHNEQAFIDKTIQSMIEQTVLPMRWVVVNDASTDRTADIVTHYASLHNFIRLVNVDRTAGRNFGNKVAAFNRGLAELKDLNYAYIGNIDADISFHPDYFENVLRALESDITLGIAGGMVASCISRKFVSQEVALDSVAGAVQLFRRTCFEQIGGYTPMMFGGIDSAAEITARMMNWRVRTFPKLRVLEHRRTGTATTGPLLARFKEGRRFHSLGYGIIFFCVRCAYRATEPPRLLGSAVALLGFLERWIKRAPLALAPDVVRYLRAEQREKLLRRSMFRSQRQVKLDNPPTLPASHPRRKAESHTANFETK
jgi:biofilm PGA synthesis N-glycosyltransferase PgaC